VACETHPRLRVQILLSPRQYIKWWEQLFTDTTPVLATEAYYKSILLS